MSEFTTQTEAPDVIEIEEAPQDEATTSTPEPEDTPAEVEQEGDNPGREAAKYRRQLRETQTALEAAQGAKEAAQRALVDHLAQAVGRIKPEALWAAGAELPNLLDDAGNVDVEKVIEATDAAAHTLGLTRTPKPDPAQGRAVTVPSGTGWAGAFAPNR